MKLASIKQIADKIKLKHKLNDNKFVAEHQDREKAKVELDLLSGEKEDFWSMDENGQDRVLLRNNEDFVLGPDGHNCSTIEGEVFA